MKRCLGFVFSDQDTLFMQNQLQKHLNNTFVPCVWTEKEEAGMIQEATQKADRNNLIVHESRKGIKKAEWVLEIYRMVQTRHMKTPDEIETQLWQLAGPVSFPNSFSDPERLDLTRQFTFQLEELAYQLSKCLAEHEPTKHDCLFMNLSLEQLLIIEREEKYDAERFAQVQKDAIVIQSMMRHSKS